MGVLSFGVVSGQPSEDLPAAGRRFGPVGIGLQDFAFQGIVERFSRALSALVLTAHRLGDPQILAEFRQIFDVHYSVDRARVCAMPLVH